MLERLMSTSEVAEYLNVPIGTIYQWRSSGVGPTGMRVGRHVRYRRAEVDKWLEARKSTDPASA